MSVLASGPSFSGTHPRFISEMYLQKKITMTKVKMSNEGKIKPSKLSYCSSTCVFLVTHHLPHPPYWDIASFQVHSTAFCSCGLCGQRKAFCRRRHCESIHFRPPVPRHGCGERVYQRAPSIWCGGGMKETVLNLAPCPFVFYILKLLPWGFYSGCPAFL